MKRNWLTYVSIVAALVAGMVCNTAFAEGKNGGNKFSGGNFRISGGGGNGGGGGGPPKQFQQLNRNTTIKSMGQAGGGNGGGLQSQGFPKVVKQVQGGQGMSGIRTMPGKFPGSLNNGNNNGGGLGIGLGGQNGKPKISINPGLGQPIGGAVLGKGSKPMINPGFGVSKSIGGTVLGKHCIPGCNPKPCNPCYNPNNKWCGPSWWWSPCWEPSYKSCYYPTTVYAYPQTIVIPVQTVVVGSPVVPVIAEQLMQIPVGATVTLQGADLGDQLGMLVVQIDKVSLPAQVNEWRPDAVNVTLPMLGLAGPTRAQLWMVKADGSVAANIAVELLPAQQQPQAAGAVVDQNSAAAALGGIE